MSRTVHEKRWHGNPSTSLTKSNENQYLAVIVDTAVANNSPDNIPVTTTTTANSVVIGEYQTYTDTDRVMIESGMAILYANTAYVASVNGQGVLSTATAGQVKAVAKNIAAGGYGTIVGGGTRTVSGSSRNVYYVTGLL